MVKIGPMYGYYPNGSKTHILTKPEHAEAAEVIFHGAEKKISVDGKRYLGGSIGTIPFQRQFIVRKVQEMTEQIKKLSEFATSQPHAAYSAFTRGISSKWNYLHESLTETYSQVQSYSNPSKQLSDHTSFLH